MRKIKHIINFTPELARYLRRKAAAIHKPIGHVVKELMWGKDMLPESITLFELWGGGGSVKLVKNQLIIREKAKSPPRPTIRKGPRKKTISVGLSVRDPIKPTDNGYQSEFIFKCDSCLYCGLLPDTIDHVIARSFNEDRRNAGIRFSSCRECNCVILGSRFFESLFLRCQFVNERLQIRYRKILSNPKWDDRELGELNGSLKYFVKNRRDLQRVIQERIDWFRSPGQIRIVQDARAFTEDGTYLRNFLENDFLNAAVSGSS